MAESDLYPFVLQWLEGAFPLARSGPRAISHRRAKVTANLEWLEGGGAWLRPDLALAHVHRRRFEPTPTLDLYTFEVKPKGVGGIAGLHQTLAHSRVGDFVLFILAGETRASPEIEAQASRFGVGIIAAARVDDWDSYKLCVTPQRMAPDADLRDQFLFRAFEGRDATDILSWLTP